jgi:hypothetical protein
MLNHRMSQDKEITGDRRMLLTIYMWGNAVSCYLHLYMKKEGAECIQEMLWSQNACLGASELAGEGHGHL